MKYIITCINNEVEILDDLYNKLFLLGDNASNTIRIDKLKEITSNLTNLNYDIYDYQKYLEDIISNNLKIEYNVGDNSTDTVKIMTIHASKGLEFNICYYGELYNRFNIKEAISNIEKQLPKMLGVQFENKDYTELEIPANSIILAGAATAAIALKPNTKITCFIENFEEITLQTV